jgi:hypothetical protein
MKIIFDRPPLFDEIDARFHIAGQPVIFAWGERIYNPQRIHIGPELMAHETVHGLQQGNDIEGWWRRYIDDTAFRLEQEIPAHQAELRVLWETGNRQDRRRALKRTASRLAAPLYGRMITPARARQILNGVAA